ncbi:ATP-binding cassette domain-containing protein, partial [Streptomyces yangpuensis]|uniref:ATP-binding cassette domain-containing protein n=1 Tax=Streptomyces yangpuensis TaxID=1648182 RepID=UPI0036C94284
MTTHASGALGIHATGLTKAYGDVRVLDGIDLAVPRGSVLALLGPNGAGKTTTVRILATLTAPDAGTARGGGPPPPPPPARARLRHTPTPPVWRPPAHT